jgi:plasmid maintenance system antidote protein VapI
MMTQSDIAEAIGGVDRSYVNKLLSGARKVSWPMAAKLANLFPDRTIQQWKSAEPSDLEKAFSELSQSGCDLKTMTSGNESERHIEIMSLLHADHAKIHGIHGIWRLPRMSDIKGLSKPAKVSNQKRFVVAISEFFLRIRSVTKFRMMITKNHREKNT